MDKVGAAAGAGGKRLLIAGAVIAALLGLAGYLAVGQRGQEVAVAPRAEAPEAAVPSEEQSEAEAPVPAGTAAVATVPEEAAAEAETEAETAAEPGSESAGEAEEAAADNAAGQAPVPPRVDEVRVEPDGLTVVAGKASPGSTVVILLDGQEVAQATADGRGAFAAIAFLPQVDAAQVLTLLQRGDGGDLASAGEVIIAPMPAPAPQAAALADASSANAAPEPSAEAQSATEEAAPEAPETQVTEMAGAANVEAAPVAVADAVEAVAAATGALAEAQAPAAESASGPVAAPETVEVAAAPEPAVNAPEVAAAAPETVAAGQEGAVAEPGPAKEAPQPQAVAVLRSTEAGVELLSSAPEAPDSVALDTIGYSDEGEVQLSGRAQSAAAEVRVYLDNAPVASLDVDGQGRWRGDLPQVDTGIYTLRIDEVAQDGTVTSRVETPFKREEPSVLAQAAAGQAGAVKAITVQKGDTLWAIARDRYGEGPLYVRVFEANRTSIRNPDLIYPGQVFDLPD